MPCLRSAPRLTLEARSTPTSWHTMQSWQPRPSTPKETQPPRSCTGGRGGAIRPCLGAPSAERRPLHPALLRHQRRRRLGRSPLRPGVGTHAKMAGKTASPLRAWQDLKAGSADTTRWLWRRFGRTPLRAGGATTATDSRWMAGAGEAAGPWCYLSSASRPLKCRSMLRRQRHHPPLARRRPRALDLPVPRARYAPDRRPRRQRVHQSPVARAKATLCTRNGSADNLRDDSSSRRQTSGRRERQ
jgi:hypothetical protein